MMPDQALCVKLLGYFSQPLENLKALGFEPKTLLDIGAAHGHFSVIVRTVWPDLHITAVEANKECQGFLRDLQNAEVHYEVLGMVEHVRPFFMTKDDPVSGGCSYYRERTIWFDDEHVITQNRQVRTLDTLLPGRRFDMIKLDTQGSELDIMKGGYGILGAATVVILEVSLFEYNWGAPLIDQVIGFMQDHSFLIFDIVGPINGGHFIGNRRNQVDIVFINREKSEWLLRL